MASYSNFEGKLYLRIIFFNFISTNVTKRSFLRFIGLGRQRMTPDSNFEGKSLPSNFFSYFILMNVINVRFRLFSSPGCQSTAPDLFLKVKPSNLFFFLIL
jgi:hypothetical protein